MPIPASQDEVAWVCEVCGQGQQITEEGLVLLRINYGDGIPSDKEGFPFWVFEGQVTLDRATYSGEGSETPDAEHYWSQPRRFMIPAYDYPIEDLIRKGPMWVKNPPDLKHGESTRFKSVTVSSEDVKALAEFIIIALEVERMDNIRSIRMSLIQDHLELWILPRVDHL